MSLIFVALDVNSKQEALKLAQSTAPYVGGFKVGPRLLHRFGGELVQELSQWGEVFVDNKYYDIPSTMLSSVQAVFESGATYCTVHAHAGPEALVQLAQLEKELATERPFKILAVTLLTSFQQHTLPVNQASTPIGEQIVVLAQQVIDSGLSGLVCSAHEVETLRQNHSEALLVVPGIRRQEDVSEDQQRVCPPDLALKKGASMLVVGRPIITAKDPAQAAAQFKQLCQKGVV